MNMSESCFHDFILQQESMFVLLYVEFIGLNFVVFMIFIP
jgi:hypothetical protein